MLSTHWTDWTITIKKWEFGICTSRSGSYQGDSPRIMHRYGSGPIWYTLTSVLALQRSKKLISIPLSVLEVRALLFWATCAAEWHAHCEKQNWCDAHRVRCLFLEWACHNQEIRKTQKEAYKWKG